MLSSHLKTSNFGCLVFAGEVRELPLDILPSIHEYTPNNGALETENGALEDYFKLFQRVIFRFQSSFSGKYNIYIYRVYI